MLTREEYEAVQNMEDQKMNIEMIISSLENDQFLETKLGLINRYNCDDKRTLRSLSLHDEAKWFEQNCSSLSKRIKAIVLKDLKNDSLKLQGRILNYISK